MRLLNVRTLQLEEFFPGEIPNYAIASHWWIRGEEPTFEELGKRPDAQVTNKSGYKKVVGFAKFVQKCLPHVEWMWIDTCCINKSNHSELSEVIISMCQWYRDAEVCLAYLADVRMSGDLEDFERSKWFRRGWTLQELVAPRTVVFLTEGWDVIGHKGETGRGKSGVQLESGPLLTPQLVAATGVPESVLNNFSISRKFTTDERLQWIAGRETTRPEDMTYSMLGIFSISMPILYGEGGANARRRLLKEIHQAGEGYGQQRSQVGPWSLGSEQLQEWKSEQNVSPWSQDYVAAMLRAVANGNLTEMRAIRRKDPLIVLACNSRGQTALHLAARDGNLEMAQYLIRNGAGINPDDDHGRLPLHEAVGAGSVSLVRALMAKGADVSAEDAEGRTPRDLCDSSSLIAWILDYGPDLEVKDRENYTALCRFAHRGNVQAVRTLLDMGVDIEAFGQERHNALYVAVGQDKPEVAKLLLLRGAKVDVRDHRHNTPLVWAGWLGHTRIGELLLEHGADINARNECDYSSLHECCEHGKQDMAVMLLRNGADFTQYNTPGWAPFHIAAAHGFIDPVREMLDIGEDIDRSVNDRSGVALHHACGRGRQPVVDLLLSRGATLDVRDSELATPLFRSCEAGQLNSVKSLLKYGADITLTHRNGSSPLHTASHRGHREIVRLLLDFAARRDIVIVNARAEHGITPLHYAAQQGYADIAIILLDQGKADINATSSAGWTALAEACSRNYLDVVLALLIRGAMTDVRTHANETAREIASRLTHKEVLRILDSFAHRKS